MVGEQIREELSNLASFLKPDQQKEVIRKIAAHAVRKAIEKGFDAEYLNWVPHTGDREGNDPKSGGYVSSKTYKVGNSLVEVRIKVV